MGEGRLVRNKKKIQNHQHSLLGCGGMCGYSIYNHNGKYSWELFFLVSLIVCFVVSGIIGVIDNLLNRFD